jgi:hypothetical protein
MKTNEIKIKPRTVEEILAKLEEMQELQRWVKDVIADKTDINKIQESQVTLSIIEAYISALHFCLGINDEKKEREKDREKGKWWTNNNGK